MMVTHALIPASLLTGRSCLAIDRVFFHSQTLEDPKRDILKHMDILGSEYKIHMGGLFKMFFPSCCAIQPATAILSRGFSFL